MKPILRKKKLTNSGLKASTRLSKEQIFMNWALGASYRSTCKRLQIGTLVVDKNLRRVLSWSYNGNYAGGPNKCDSVEPGNCGCVHSEINALIGASKEPGMTMFVADSPYIHCAKCIINAGVETLYYNKEYRDKTGLNLLRSKIKVIKL